MDEKSKQMIIDNYRSLFLKYGSGPQATQGSLEGQVLRFDKLLQIADLKQRSIIDLGCGIGDLYPYLLGRFGEVDYLGIDIVPEMIEYAARKYPRARFMCCDILKDGLDETCDYVLISGIFNNAFPDCTNFLKEMISAAFQHCRLGLGFNFISTYVNFTEPVMAYHDPAEIFDFCLRSLTRKVSLHHHYERCDVAVFAYR